MRIRVVGLVLGALLLALTPLGCGGSSGGGGSTGITVSGVIVGLEGGPRPFIPVAIGGRLLVSDANGAFSVSGVSAPYEAIVFDPGDRGATVYVGLTRADPRLVMFRERSIHRSQFTGSVSGGAGYPLPAMHQNRLYLGETRRLFGAVTPNATTGDFASSTDQTTWAGPRDLPVTAYAYQWVENALGEVTAFTGFGSAPMTLRTATTTSTGVIPLSPVGSDSVGGTFTVPAGFSLNLLRMWVNPAGFDRTRSWPPTVLGNNFAFRVPTIPGAMFQVEVTLDDGVTATKAQQRVAAGTTNIVLDPPPVNDMLTPADGAMNVDYTTPFTWTPSSFGVHVLFLFGAFADDLDIAVVTAGTEATIPDLSAYGYGLPTSAGQTWRVLSFGPYTSVDDLAGVGSMVPTVGVGYETDTGFRTFTTAP